jgi:hypothetical protein
MYAVPKSNRSKLRMAVNLASVINTAIIVVFIVYAFIVHYGELQPGTYLIFSLFALLSVLATLGGMKGNVSMAIILPGVCFIPFGMLLIFANSIFKIIGICNVLQFVIGILLYAMARLGNDDKSL